MPLLQRSRNRNTALRGMPELKLEGERVMLRPPVRDDWQQWSLIREKNRKHLEPFEPKWRDGNQDSKYWDRRLARQSIYWGEDRGYYFLILDRNDSELIGGININNVVRGAAQFASIGYWIDQDNQGKGLMRESLQLVLAYAFQELRLHRINASCMPHNQRSINLLKRLGFAEEGFAKRYIQINGEWEDHLLFGLNCEDFKRPFPPGEVRPAKRKDSHKI